MERRSPRDREAETPTQGGVRKKHSAKSTHPPNPTFEQVKRKGRMAAEIQLTQLSLSDAPFGSGTGLVYDERMASPRDSSHPQTPERLTAIMDKIKEYGLLHRCTSVNAREATEEEILRVHSQEYVELMKSTQTMDTRQLEELSQRFDSVHLHPMSYISASLAAGSVLELVDKVTGSELRNGLALVSPPGRQGHRDRAEGDCVFNTLAIATEHAKHRHTERILIVDWSTHPAEATQNITQDDPRVLYLSVHHREGPEPVGVGGGINVNIPWERTGMSDADYLAAFHRVLLPVAYEFNPQLVLVAAGFDAGIGDPEGKMAVSAAGFARLTHCLQSLASGRLCLVLEGGSNLESVAEGVSACLKILLHDPCPPPTPPLTPSHSALMCISAVTVAQQSRWKSLNFPAVCVGEGETGGVGERERLTLPPSTDRTGIIYDPQMMGHYNMWDRNHPECPERISSIFQRHVELSLVSRCVSLPTRTATETELLTCHGAPYVEVMKRTEMMKARELSKLASEYNSVYLSPASYHSATLAAGSTLSAVTAVMEGRTRCAVCIVRPPGHHAQRDQASGFCLFNNVALAVQQAQNTAPTLRVLIVDWDVHHGNGTQQMFEDNPSVLYISLHRYDNATFFPACASADYSRTGTGGGRGYTVNIPWNSPRLGDSEYLTAFLHIVMPIATQFDPGLVIVSCGFDAARGDPLGGFLVTPEAYGHFTHSLSSLAEGRVVLVLEGGYNLSSISESLAVCTSVLLGDPPPPLSVTLSVTPCVTQSLHNVVTTHKQFWAGLQLPVPTTKASDVCTEMGREERESEGEGEGGDRERGREREREGYGEREGDRERERERETASVQDLTDSVNTLSLEERGEEREEERANETEGERGNEGEGERGGEQGNEREAERENGARANEALSLTPSHHSKAVILDQETLQLSEAAGGSEAQEGGMFFAVTPLSWCPHLDLVTDVPEAGIHSNQPCEACEDITENWVCLTCYKVFCGRYVRSHMVTHGLNTQHPLVLSLADLSVWCYSCESYIHHPVLTSAKMSAYTHKFGEREPGTETH